MIAFIFLSRRVHPEKGRLVLVVSKFLRKRLYLIHIDFDLRVSDFVLDPPEVGDFLEAIRLDPVLPKSSRHWSGADVLIASAPQRNHFSRPFDSRSCEVLTEHALEVSYFFEVLGERFFQEALTAHCYEIEFFGRLASAADACLLEQPDATAHLVCAAVLREAYAMAKHIDKGEFDFLIAAEGNQIGDDLTLAGRRTGYSSIKETIEFFRGRGIKIYEAV
jgi:hypothetical protein